MENPYKSPEYNDEEHTPLSMPFKFFLIMVFIITYPILLIVFWFMGYDGVIHTETIILSILWILVFLVIIFVVLA